MKKQFFLAAVLCTGLAACQNTAGEGGSKGQADTTAVIGVALPTYEDTAHHAANALDIAGAYAGVLPCGSCEGIRTELLLSNDKRFVLKESYLGKKEPLESSMKGNWVVHENTMTLQFSPEVQDRVLQYKVEENRLRQLDQSGQPITGDLADKYILTKQ